MTAETLGGTRIAAGATQRGLLADRAFQGLTLFFAALVLLVLCGVIVALVFGSLPALRKFGFDFLATET